MHNVFSVLVDKVMFEAGARPNFLGLAAENNRAAHEHAENAARMVSNRNEWILYSRKQAALIAKLEDALAVQTAHADGLAAQAWAFAEAYPACNLRMDSGKRFKNGDVKSNIGLIYEAAFDASLTKLLGISNPASRRKD